MRKTSTFNTDKKITVDITGLQAMLGTGKRTAGEIAQSAGAVLTVGRRKLYYVPKIEAYIADLTKEA